MSDQPPATCPPQPPRPGDLPGGTGPGHPADPDAHDLPPGVVLPSAAVFRKGQLMARLIVAIVSLVVLIVFLFVFPDESRIISLCTGLVAAVVVISFVRYRQACHQVREEQVG